MNDPLKKLLTCSKFWETSCKTNLKCYGCICGLKNGNCDDKNVVYMLSCKLCKARYIGASARCVSTRIGEHVRGAASKNGVIGAHNLKYHPDLVCNLNEASFESKVLWKGDNGSVKSAEAVFIRSMKPEINIMLNTPA